MDDESEYDELMTEENITSSLKVRKSRMRYIPVTDKDREQMLKNVMLKVLNSFLLIYLIRLD